MNATPLRIYQGPPVETSDSAPQPEDVQTVTAPLGKIAPLLADAIQSQRTWVRDFEDDEITIPMDLYEVLLAYQHFRRPSA
ncbi:MAG: hypothetical protein HQ582_30590 [Planctomycetes bacterium]|nr:hypothetical protein [Planctomycetota bacterium]